MSFHQKTYTVHTLQICNVPIHLQKDLTPYYLSSNLIIFYKVYILTHTCQTSTNWKKNLYGIADLKSLPVGSS